jgi:hypothetical protein
MAELSREVASLENAGAGAMSADREVSYEILKMTRDFDLSALALGRAVDDREASDKALLVVKQTVADYEALLADLESAPLMMAARGDIAVAIVPYDNSNAAKPGAPIYACRIGLIGCSKVGRVGATLPGEVVGKHPLFNKDLRGRMIRLELEDNRAIEKLVLHLGRAPLFI